MSIPETPYIRRVLIDKQRLMSWLTDEAEERMALMKPSDPPAVKIADVAFLQALEVVGTYVEEVARPTERAA